MAKRLVFSNATPNDQGGVIPNSVIDFTRFRKNPVLLKEHRWGDDPLGTLTDIRLIDGQYSGIPVFHLETQASREAAGMYAKDSLNAASIGGEALWKKNPVTDDYYRDEQGNRLCEKFFLYEISLVSLPSNMDAVGVQSALAAKIYEDAGIYEEMDRTITLLSSKFKAKFMEPTPEEIAAQKAKADADAKLKADAEQAKLSAAAGGGTVPDNLPAVIKDAIKNGGSVTINGSAIKYAAGSVPTPKDEPESKIGDKTTGDPQPDPIGLAAIAYQRAKSKLSKAKEKAEECIQKAEKAKKDADDSESEEMASHLAAALKAAEEAVKECESMEKECDKAKESAEDEEMAAKMKLAGKTNTTLGAGAQHSTTQAQPAIAASTEPVRLTAEQARAKLTLAAEPSLRAYVGREAQGVTFTKLNSSKAGEKDQALIKRVFNADKTSTQVSVGDHAIILASILNDPRLKAVVEKTRMVTADSESHVSSMRNNPQAPRGRTLQQLSAELNAGQAKYWNRSNNQMENLTMLTSTDNALASPALNTIEWLSLAIFELFPTTSWKAGIPMFGAQMTSRNTGIIFANVVANPAVYKGTSPAPASDYTYTDQAVALALTPYWLQPMLWNPLTMHQLRYDQMATGWAQAFAKWNSVMDDNLIYTLASTTPANAIVPTSGVSGYNYANPLAFNIPQSGPQNQFYWNTAFAGSLLTPTLNDIIGIEQVYRNQNFQLEREKAMLVIDPIMERYLAQDPETKSLLTRFMTANNEEFLGYKHTMFDVRSRVAVYDPATGTVKDINSAIPGTAVSAGIGFIPSQVGMGIGMLDVFMVQDPANYGYRMSADIRIGVVPLRYNFYGTSLYTFAGQPV